MGRRCYGEESHGRERECNELKILIAEVVYNVAHVAILAHVLYVLYTMYMLYTVYVTYTYESHNVVYGKNERDFYFQIHGS